MGDVISRNEQNRARILNIIDKVLEGKEAVIKSNNYIYELEDLIEKENQLCKAISENTIRKLLLNVPKQVINRRNNQSYISKAKITLSKLQYAEEYLGRYWFVILAVIIYLFYRK